MKTLSALILFIITQQIAAYGQSKPGKVIQFDISLVLNARPVTIINNGKLVTWQNGIDGGGKADGYLTRSAAVFNHQDSTHTLPDDALFRANNAHPEIKLHYSNHDTVHYQACSMPGESVIRFQVTAAKYKALYMALTSAEGASSLQIELIYEYGSEIKEVLLPDYYADIPAGSPNLCYLVHDLAKWGPANQMAEKDHHNIDLLKIIPDQGKTLKEIKISKNKNGYLVFWAAAGVK
jgi:hypothetical protein